MREILTLNAGSSSIKFALFVEAESGLELDMRGSLSGLGYTPKLVTRDGAHGEQVHDVPGLGDRRLDPEHAVRILIEWLAGTRGLPKLSCVGHRVVHGGARTAPHIVDDALMAELHDLVPLAPLHEPANIAGIEAARKALPGIAQVACFDTAFHAHHEPAEYVFALPAEIRAAGVRRYGFHGLSCENAMAWLRENAPDRAMGRVIIAHLGAGASVSAARGGIGVASSMGMTAVDGLPMTTRCGALDAGAVLHMIDALGLSTAEVADILYHRSGLAGLSGLSGDMRELLASDSADARLAVEYFVRRTAATIAAMAAAAGGMDALVFTGGIGERGAEIRRRIEQRLRWAGVAPEDEAMAGARDSCLSAPDAAVALYVVTADEERMIASHAHDCVTVGAG